MLSYIEYRIPPLHAEPRKVRPKCKQLHSLKRTDVGATNYSNQLEEEKTLVRLVSN